MYPSSPYLPCNALNTTSGLNALKFLIKLPLGSHILVLYFFFISRKTPLAVFKIIYLSLENPPAIIRIFFFIYFTKIISKSKFIPVLLFTLSLTKSINFFISL